MTNLEKWQYYLKGFISPDSYIEMGFYSMISMALARRVWKGPPEMPLFPNMYVIFVGEPATGKGLILNQVKDIISSFSYEEFKQRIIEKAEAALSDEEKRKREEIRKARAEINRQKLKIDMVNAIKNKTKIRKEDDMLFPMAPNSTSCEHLVFAHARCTRDIQVPKCVLAPHGVYIHNSLSFVLTEIASLFQLKKENIVTYLVDMYDGILYTYECMGREKDTVKNGCLNMLGGTQASFLEDVFSTSLLTQGFASRTIFVCETKPRFAKYGIDPFSAEQLQAKNDVVKHIEKLATLFGQVTFSDEAFEFNRYYIEEIFPKEYAAAGKLKDFIGRKASHLDKLAMVIHFGESTEREVQLSSCQRAFSLMQELEKKMELILNYGGKNPLNKHANKVLRYLEENDQVTLKELWKLLVIDLRSNEIVDLLGDMAKMEQIAMTKEGKETVIRKLKEKI